MTTTQLTPTTKHNTCYSCPHARHCLPTHTHIAQSPLFEMLQFSSKLLKRGEILCRQGQHSDNLYIIRSGILKSSLTKANGEEYIMGFYLPPDLFGWEGIDDNHSLTITALDQSNICVIPTEKMFSLTQQHPRLGAQLLQMVSRRIQEDNVALLRTTALQRVATFLLQLESRYRHMGFMKNTIPTHMTHHDIANYLRITPSTISRLFHELEHKKMICVENHQIRLLDGGGLHALAE